MKILLVLSLLIIIMLETPRLVREKMWRELAAFSVILVVAYALAFLKVLGIKPL
ncbi:hypothetical protein [Desulfoscipio geothermicus]|jgi:hypothetical protein|uniref:Uncharacterized protein n=1 Tax=Desulfoscipio geothermicus DSM 3669 TaxID=1121426 RepID=A0A1I6DWH1_9FIRM|nr:hypothetical protein [Desulfoscipio geothermicus]SFR09786.1 hypothetical protein SAMN05660706_11959 [Desulfoscipio geothermicus DSM 3669]